MTKPKKPQPVTSTSPAKSAQEPGLPASVSPSRVTAGGFRVREQTLRDIPAELLKPHPKNFRLHPEHQQKSIKAALNEVGFVGGLLVRAVPGGTFQILDGHCRTEQFSAGEMVPCVVIQCSDADADKIIATHDQIGALAEIDPDILRSLTDDIDFTLPDLDDLLAEVLAAALPDEEPEADEPPDIVEDDVPEPPSDPITKPGDLWTLGEHRLLCGDSTNADDVARLMNGEKADLCFTSPPYGQQRNYDSGQGSGDWDALMQGVFGNLPMAESGQVLVNLGLIHRKNEWVPYWDGWIEWMRQHGWRRFGWYVWDQGAGMPGDWNGRFAPSFEFVFHFNKKSVRPVKNTECNHAGESNHGMGMRKASGEVCGYSHVGKSVQDKRIADNVIRVGRHKARGIEVTHPAVFPVALPAFIANAWLGLIYEPFCGSGTTIIAAETLGRRCFGMEISPAYCDVIVKRWETLTGNVAERQSAGS